MIWIGIVICILLFYKLVERKHKIIALKFLVVLACLLGLGVGLLNAYDYIQRSRKRDLIVITHEFDEVVANPEVIERLIGSAFSGVSKSLEITFPGLSEKETQFAKHLILIKWVNHQKFMKMLSEELKQYSPWKDYDELAFDIPSSQKSSHNIEEFQKKRVDKYLSQLPEMRKRNSEPKYRLLYGFFIHTAKQTIDLPEINTLFINSLSSDDLAIAENFSSLRARANEKMLELIADDASIPVKHSFKICNNNDLPLDSYYFYVSGLAKGRSTKRAIDRNSSYSSNTKIEGDIIVPPSTCSVFEWKGPYLIFDRYEISGLFGEWGKL